LKKTTLLSLLALAVPLPAAAGPFTVQDNMKLKRVADPQVSPDGKWVAFQAQENDLASGARNTDIWLVATAGGEPRRLTTHPKADTHPRWSPDGKQVAFLSTRDGAPQVFVQPVAGGEARRVTSLSTDAGGVLWIDGTTLLVASDVYPECGADDACNKKKIDTADKPSTARVYDSLLLRHWDTWEDHRRTHLLAVPAAGGPARDLTPGTADTPPFSLSDENYAVSPDGREVCFTRVDDAQPALSTNGELYVVPTAGGTPVKIAGSPGFDGLPRYSPDGTKIAFRAQVRAGYEADRWRLMVYDRQARSVKGLTEAFDRHVESIAWSPDSRTLFFTAGEAGRDPVFSVPAAGGEVKTVATGAVFSDPQATPDGKALVATQSSLTHPNEVYRIPLGGGAPVALTKMNDAFLAGFGLKPGESVTFKGAAGKDVQAWIVKPADFDPARKYPLLVLIHGGPQGAWSDSWSFRWNPQLFAGAGYVVIAPNPRGSIGWGQEFVDDINADWGGRAYEDVMKATDYAEALPYVEKGRTAAAGASYGGYMVDWILGHTDRYRALVSHDGVYDLATMYGSTEELWFVEWEFKGPVWEQRELYERWNPSRFVQNFKTPTLVVHGELDYRVPLEQSLSLFTALQRRGVPSRLLVFPDENHWVLKPANSVRWYQEVLGWLDRWTKG
jgi:dipeptidyl aminopeptidase/acylaminoacyl peptidase